MKTVEYKLKKENVKKEEPAYRSIINEGCKHDWRASSSSSGQIMIFYCTKCLKVKDVS